MSKDASELREVVSAMERRLDVRLTAIEKALAMSFASTVGDAQEAVEAVSNHQKVQVVAPEDVHMRSAVQEEPQGQ